MGRKILIIDDEPEYCEVLSMRLGTSDFDVVVAHDGTEGLAKARQDPPDLILLDVMLPGADGGDIAQKIHADPGLSKIPVIFLTAAITADESKRRWDAGEERMLAKTMDASMILQRIDEVLAEA